MTLGRYLVGIPLAALALIPVYLGARRVRRVLLPGWSGLDAWLADFVLWLVVVVVTAEALGTFGVLSTGWVVVALALVGSGIYEGARRVHPRPSTVHPDDLDVTAAADGSRTGDGSDRATPRWQLVVAGLTILPLAGSWLARTLRSMNIGMITTDTLWYHLTVAARFVQTGRTTSIQFIDADTATAYFPATSSLLHSLAMLMFGTDLVSTIVSLAWLVVALAAAWLVGRPFGVAPLTMIGAGLLLAGPGMVETQPGGALNDVTGVALLLIAVAFAMRNRGADRTMGQDLVIGLAAGLSIGMKFTFIAPAVALCIALVITGRRGTRLRRTLMLLGAALLSGGYWYLRNLIAVGNPLPSLAVHLGPISLPYLKGNVPTQTFSHYVFHGEAWHRYFFHGLQDALGPAWWLFGVFVFVGVVGGLIDRDSRIRMLACLCAVSLVAYIVSPQYLDLLPGVPGFFATNLRYAAPGLVFGLILLPLVLRRWANIVLPVMALAMIWTQTDPVSWPTGLDRASFFQDHISRRAAVAGAIATLMIAVVVLGGTKLIRRSPAARRLSVRGWMIGPVVLLLGLGLVHGHYERNRNLHLAVGGGGVGRALSDSYAWARTVDHARVGVAGVFLQLQYPYTGDGWTNYVQYVGVETNGGGFRAPRSCNEWVSQLSTGRYDYVVLSDPKLSTWTQHQPDARLVRSIRATSPLPVHINIIALDGSREGRTC